MKANDTNKKMIFNFLQAASRKPQATEGGQAPSHTHGFVPLGRSNRPSSSAMLSKGGQLGAFLRGTPKQSHDLCRGQAAIIAVLLLMSGMLVLSGSFSSFALKQARTVRAGEMGSQSYFLAEAGVEDVAYRFKTGREVSEAETITLSGATAVTSVVANGSEREISAQGNADGHMRNIFVKLSLGEGVDFNYGIEAGNGGFFIENNAVVIGNVFSNGKVEGQNSNLIKGAVISAGPAGEVEGIHATSSVYAREIENSFIEGDAYYTLIDGGTTVLGTKHPGSPTIATTSMPISEETIDEWEVDAAAGGVISSPCPYIMSGTATIGPVKINCDVEISGSADVTLAGTVWVRGNVVIKNNAVVRVASALSGKSVAVIANNPASQLSASTVKIDNNAAFIGAGAGSYVLVVSRNRSASVGGGVRAIEIGNQADAGSVLLYSSAGEILLQNNASLREVTAYRIHIKNNAQVTYETGLAHTFFDSGPSGGYEILDWQEVE